MESSKIATLINLLFREIETTISNPYFMEEIKDELHKGLSKVQKELLKTELIGKFCQTGDIKYSVAAEWIFPGFLEKTFPL